MDEQTPQDAYVESCLIDLSKQLTEAEERIEHQKSCMTEAMQHAAQHWKANGASETDQLGVVALILAHGLGLTKDEGLEKPNADR